MIYYGVESGSPRIQETCGKKLDVAIVVPRVKQTLRTGIKPMLSFILGFPEETKADVQLTFDLISRVLENDGAQVQLHLLTPLAGSQLYEQFGDDIELDTYFSDITYGVTSTDDLVFFRKYPEVFSSFYHFRTRDVSRNTYVGSDQFLYAASSELRHTIRALSLYFGGLWQAYCRWKEFTLSLYPENGFGSMSFADIISTVAAFAQHCAELKQEAFYLNDLAQYEAVLYELGKRIRESGTAVSWKEACRAEPSELGLSQKVTVKEFHFDIPAAIEFLKSGSGLWPPEKKTCHLLLFSTDAGRTTTLRMSQDTADAIGRIAQGDSLRECLSSYSKPVGRAIQTLVSRGIIVKRAMESDLSCI